MEIKFFNAGCGDGIQIRFKGDDELFHNILIDGGTEKGTVYEQTLQIAIEQIIDRKEIIDLWIITHIDDDHIGGILRLINDDRIFKRLDFSKTKIWYNFSKWDFDTGIRSSKLKSVRQGIRLREFFSKYALLNEYITDELGTINFYGVKLTILSPNGEKLKQMIAKWEKEETKIYKKRASERKVSKPSDYKTKIADFDVSSFVEDGSEENGSSIAMLVSFNGNNFLFLADSHPTVIVQSLINLGYLPNEKQLELEYLQIAHHGSKSNTNDKLLNLIRCSRFVISADGLNKNNLPNKLTFARIMKRNKGRHLQFYITQKNRVTTSIFDVDGEMENVSIFYPESETNYLTFNL
jgi:beta-lactamase superfamily II metal-dependent hydrolase